MNKFFTNLELWWKTRASDVKAGKTVSPITLRGLFYLMRQKVGIRQMPKTKGGFYSNLKRIEEQSKIAREKLRIVTEPKVNLITRLGESPLLKVNLDSLKNACAVIYIEKSTIIEAIEEDKSLTDRGIYIIKAMGFSPREVSKTIKKVQDLGIPILTLTDYDPSGLLIDLKISDYGVKTIRLGIDPELVKALGLKIGDVREALPRSKSKLVHYKYLQTNYPKMAKGFLDIGLQGQPYRIELDGVFALAGKDRFIEEILKRADLAIPIKQVKKALNYKKVPKKVEGMRNTVHDLVDGMFNETATNAEQGLEKYDKSFNDMHLSKIEKGIEDTIEKKGEQVSTTEVLEETIKALQKLLEEQKKKEGKI
jgi:hypothetical protein